MMIDARLATEIVARTVEVMPFDVNVMDAHGLILASSDAARVGEIHAGAQLALARARAVEIDDAMAANLSGVRPGINLPLSVRGKVCGVIGVTGEPDAVRGFGELLRVTAELILEREQLTVELRRNARHREEFVLQLLRRTAASAELEAWADRLGIDVRVAHAAIVCRLSGVDADPEAGVGQIEAMQSQLAHEWPQLLTAKTSYLELVMFDAIDARAARDGALAKHAGKRLAALEGTLRKVATQPFSLALGIALDGIDGFERSYQCALATLRVGAARAPRENTYSYYEFVLPVLLSALSQGWQAQQLRLPLTRLLARERRSGALLDTLKAWYANDGHPSATAEALGIHRNTLDYRLQQIRDATGLDLGAMDDRLWLYIALQTTVSRRDGDEGGAGDGRSAS
ncbi:MULTISPECIES: sugar diacid recognition domain-containing protein [Burkholderia]|uniref:sugar diacid recognition domain-containing protein n=1 Tax=Burkholderia TaxID=32008 RepID=UPI0005312483|nr:MULTISPECIES: sugar diacid recognition domain-containing protein [Burkholderia]AOJ72731.1 transcriptional regulator [Burkholderia savannae]AOK49037.1 transcriptional regulator [Burkholderia sp. MSMB617WGS]KGS04261.1 bacterial regulatory, Fis family protein [Burkholderia sp. ABCPW 111]KVG45039.1 transcriptional regulator [Burkholderia sp. MSMB0265]KVG90029.1 transcriptional regulator [Burkholderia sp. MSMB2040]